MIINMCIFSLFCKPRYILFSKYFETACLDPKIFKIHYCNLQCNLHLQWVMRGLNKPYVGSQGNLIARKYRPSIIKKLIEWGRRKHIEELGDSADGDCITIDRLEREWPARHYFGNRGQHLIGAMKTSARVHAEATKSPSMHKERSRCELVSSLAETMRRLLIKDTPARVTRVIPS